MTYNKPELVVSGNSVQLIQGSKNPATKHVQTFPDVRNSQELDATIGAYESDE